MSSYRDLDGRAGAAEYGRRLVSALASRAFGMPRGLHAALAWASTQNSIARPAQRRPRWPFSRRPPGRQAAARRPLIAVAADERAATSAFQQGR